MMIRRIALVLLLISSTFTLAQQFSAPVPDKGTTMLTIFLRHDESKTLDQIDQHLKETGFDKNLPGKESNFQRVMPVTSIWLTVSK